MGFGVIGHYLEMDRRDRQRYPELYNIKGRSTNSFANPITARASAPSPYRRQFNITQLPGTGNGSNTIPAETAHIRDYMCWSLVNVFFGGLFLGVISLLLSSSVRNHKIEGHVGEAQNMSIITAIWNGFLTLAGIAGIVLFSLYASGTLY
jgi:hypothetical protein